MHIDPMCWVTAPAAHRLPDALVSVTTPSGPAGSSSAQPANVSAQHVLDTCVRPPSPCTKQRSPSSSAHAAVPTSSSARTVVRIRSAQQTSQTLPRSRSCYLQAELEAALMLDPQLDNVQHSSGRQYC